MGQANLSEIKIICSVKLQCAYSINDHLKIWFFPEISPYKEMLLESRWDKLVEQFRQENYRLFQLASQSVFTVALQAGLSALKTPYPLFY